MKPSVILYKALPDDLLQRLQEHFTVHQVANLSPQTVEQNAAIFAEAEGLLGQMRMLMPHCWKKCRNCVPHQRSPSAMTILMSMRLPPEKFC